MCSLGRFVFGRDGWVLVLANQGAELMGKYGINVPKGVAVSSHDEIKKAIQDVFPNENEVIRKVRAWLSIFFFFNRPKHWIVQSGS